MITESSAPELEGEVNAAPVFDLTPEERWPFYAADEVDAACKVLRSGLVSQWTGPEVFQFEKACTARFGGGNGIALANGSVALELALKALGIGPGDEVIVTPRSFVASAFCVMLIGAKPVFADVDADSGNLTVETIQKVITPLTRAIIPVHFAGWPADMTGIMELAKEKNIRVIEDCAQAHGAEIHGRSVGSFGDAAAFSFCQDKIITTGGEGGFLSLRDRELWKRAWSFKDHGKNRDEVFSPSPVPGEFRWVHDTVGTNWRLTGPQAAIGLVQLKKLAAWQDVRRQNADIWKEALQTVPEVRVPLPDGQVQHAFYKLYFYIQGRPAEVAVELRREILQRCNAEGIRVFSGSCSELYREAAFSGHPHSVCPVARELGTSSLMVEVHPSLNQERLRERAKRLASVLRDVLA